MGIFRNITGFIGRWIAPKQEAEPPKKPAPEAQASKWAENIRMHLDHLNAKGTIRIKQHNQRPECSCTMASMLDAYLLYVSLPDVVPEKVQAWCSADDLFYTYERWPQTSLTLTDRVHREGCDAAIRLTRGEDTLFTILITLENRQNKQIEIYDADNQNQQ